MQIDFNLRRLNLIAERVKFRWLKIILKLAQKIENEITKLIYLLAGSFLMTRHFSMKASIA